MSEFVIISIVVKKKCIFLITCTHNVEVYNVSYRYIKK